MGEKIADSVVKIDSRLLRDIDDFIKQEDNRLRFANKKQFIDLAVYEYFRRLKNRDEKGVENE